MKGQSESRSTYFDGSLKLYYTKKTGTSTLTSVRRYQAARELTTEIPVMDGSTHGEETEQKTVTSISFLIYPLFP